MRVVKGLISRPGGPEESPAQDPAEQNMRVSRHFRSSHLIRQNSVIQASRRIGLAAFARAGSTIA